MNNLTIIDASSILTLASQRKPRGALTKANIVACAYSEYLNSINIQDSYPVIIFDQQHVSDIYKISKIQKQFLEPQIIDFPQFAMDLGFNVVHLDCGGIVDWKIKIISIANKLGLEIHSHSLDVFFESLVEARHNIFIKNLLKQSPLSNNESIFEVPSSYIYHIFNLIGLDWFLHHFNNHPKPNKRKIKGIGLEVAIRLLKKYSTVNNIFSKIEALPRAYISSFNEASECLLKNSPTFNSCGLYSIRDLERAADSICLDSFLPKEKNIISLIEFYTKYKIQNFIEKAKVESLMASQNVSKNTALRRIRKSSSTAYDERFYSLNNAECRPVVYRIRNKLNGKMYFGSTKDINSRAKKHWLDLQISMHHNPQMNADFKAHGAECFQLRILDACSDINSARIKEQLYIDMFYGRECCYNYSIYADKNNLTECKYRYSACSVFALSGRYKRGRGSVHLVGHGSWLSVHAAAKDLKMSKLFVRKCFEAAHKAGGEKVIGEWRFIIKRMEAI